MAQRPAADRAELSVEQSTRGNERLRITNQLVKRSQELFAKSVVLCAESKSRITKKKYSRHFNAIKGRQEPPPRAERLEVRKKSVVKPLRRELTERLAPWVVYLSTTTADEAFCQCYRQVIERASEDGDWTRRSSHLTVAQRNALTMVQLWEQALATLKAWERSASWATEERVIEDCLDFIEFVGRAASELEPRVLH